MTPIQNFTNKLNDFNQWQNQSFSSSDICTYGPDSDFKIILGKRNASDIWLRQYFEDNMAYTGVLKLEYKKKMIKGLRFYHLGDRLVIPKCNHQVTVEEPSWMGFSYLIEGTLEWYLMRVLTAQDLNQAFQGELSHLPLVFLKSTADLASFTEKVKATDLDKIEAPELQVNVQASEEEASQCQLQQKIALWLEIKWTN